jgi:flagellar hook-length control protein FliK
MLKPLPANPAPLRSFAEFATGADSKTPARFGAMLAAAQRGVAATMPLFGGRAGAPSAPARDVQARLPKTMVEAPVSGRPGRESAPLDVGANSDESRPAEPASNHPAVVASPADVPVIPLPQPDLQAAAFLVQAANPVGPTAGVPPAAGALALSGDKPPAGRAAGREVLALPLSPGMNVVAGDNAIRGGGASSNAEPPTPTAMPHEQAAVPSTLSTALSYQNNPTISPSSQPEAPAAALVLSDRSGPSDGGGQPNPSAGPPSIGGQYPPSIVSMTQSAAAAATTAPATDPTTPAPLLGAQDPLGRPPAPFGAPPARTPQGTRAVRTPPQSGPTAAANTLVAAGPARTVVPQVAGERPRASPAAPGTQIAALQSAASPSPASVAETTPPTLADTLQRMTGAGIEGMALFKGPNREALEQPINPETAATDPAPALDAATGGSGVSSPLGAPGPQSPAGIGLVSADLPGEVVSPIVRQPGREAASDHGPERTGAADPQTALVQANDMQAAPTREAASPGTLPAPASPAGSVVDQIAPDVIRMTQRHGANGRLSISITPDALGLVHVTVERATDGTTSIHVAAEHLATMELLRQDQGDLARALDQAGIGSEGRSLSFSWNGGGGGMTGWSGGSGHQPGGSPQTDVIGHYIEETISGPSAAAAARGGIDVTA